MTLHCTRDYRECKIMEDEWDRSEMQQKENISLGIVGEETTW